MTEFKNLIQPHCATCGEAFWAEDLVHTDTMFEQIQHVECFSFKTQYIKETGTFEEIVNKHQMYKYNFHILKKGQLFN